MSRTNGSSVFINVAKDVKLRGYIDGSDGDVEIVLIQERSIFSVSM